MQHNFTATGGHLRILWVRPLFTILFIISSTSVFAQSLLIHEKNGEETGISFNRIRKISFPSGELMIDRVNGTNSSFLLTSVRNLQFTGNIVNTSTDVVGTAHIGFDLFPNPTANLLNLRIFKVDQLTYSIEILSFDGRSILIKEIDNSGGIWQIEINELPKGLYLCRISNGIQRSTKKFIKN